MANSLKIKTRPITRDKLASFLKNPELIKAFENLTEDVSVTLPAATVDVTKALEQAQTDIDALSQVPFIIFSASEVVPQARTLAVGSGLELTDNGPGEQVVLDVVPRSFGAVLAENVSDSTGLFVNAPGMTIPLIHDAAYVVDGVFSFQSDATVPSVGLGFSLPLGATISGHYAYTTDTAPLTDPPASPGMTEATGPLTVITGQWLIKTGSASGDAQLRFKSMLSTYSVTLVSGRCSLNARQIE